MLVKDMKSHTEIDVSANTVMYNIGKQITYCRTTAGSDSLLPVMKQRWKGSTIGQRC